MEPENVYPFPIGEESFPTHLCLGFFGFYGRKPLHLN